MVDTGWTVSAIDETAAKQLNLQVTSHREKDGSKTRTVKIRALKIGARTLHDVPFTVGDLSGMRSPANKVTGIIGENILNQFTVKFDFKNSVMTLNKPDSHPRTGLNWIKTRPYEGAGIVFDGTIDGAAKVPFLFDTGTIANQLPNKFIKSLI